MRDETARARDLSQAGYGVDAAGILRRERAKAVAAGDTTAVAHIDQLARSIRAPLKASDKLRFDQQLAGEPPVRRWRPLVGAGILALEAVLLATLAIASDVGELWGFSILALALGSLALVRPRFIGILVAVAAPILLLLAWVPILFVGFYGGVWWFLLALLVVFGAPLTAGVLLLTSAPRRM